MNHAPIYTEALREAKRRTRKGSPERAALVAMDERTTPSPGRSTGPHVVFNAPGSVFTPDILAEMAKLEAQRKAHQK